MLTRIQALTGRAFANRELVRRFDGASQEDERSLWWLVDPPADLEEPLADRIESEVVRLLQRTPGIDRGGAGGGALPGISRRRSPRRRICWRPCSNRTPRSCPTSAGHWRLLAQEAPAVRRDDLDEARRMLQRDRRAHGLHRRGRDAADAGRRRPSGRCISSTRWPPAW